MGWLRIMRPGSVIGEQQHYLCAVDAALQAACRRTGGGGASSFGSIGVESGPEQPVSHILARPASDAIAPSVLAAQVCAGMLRRSASAVPVAGCDDARRNIV